MSGLSAQKPTRIVVDRYGEFICEVRDGGVDAEAGYWPLNPVPPRIAATVTAIEDRRFHFHPGVDPVAIVRALIQNGRSGYIVSGASTLAMQVTRLQHPADRTIRNKLIEMLKASAITIRHGRARIMDEYLRRAPYGNGIRGIGYAAWIYFGKPAEDLSWAEIAFLSAIPQQPNGMNPRTGSGRVRLVRRARRIIEIIGDKGLITKEEAGRAWNQVAEIVLQPRPVQHPETVHASLRYRRLLKECGNILPENMTIVRTGIDLHLQSDVAEQARLCVSTWGDSGAGNAAIMVIDVRKNAVAVSLGSTDYFDETRAGAIDFTCVKRSPGSTLKPFLYALAMENGIIDPDSRLPDRLTHAGGFRNFDGIWLGDIPVHRALASSRNIPAVELLRRTGVHRTFGCFADLGFHQYEKECDHYGLGMAVGGLPVAMDRLVSAFLVFTNKGWLKEYRWYEEQPVPPAERLFSEKTVQWINRTLSDPMARLPSFPRMGHLEYDYPVAVKTGTSEGCRDAWTIAWSPDYLTAVWLGRPDGQPMHNVSGYRASAELARVIMDRLHENRRSLLNDRESAAWFTPHDAAKSVVEVTLQESIDTGIRLTNSIREPNPSEPTARIISPESGAIYIIDPDVPHSNSTLLLSADIEPAVPAVTWDVDGVAYATVEPPYSTEWQLIPGHHRVRLRIPSVGSISETVSIEVRGNVSSDSRDHL
ncbi:transglycosylase domain-containing protein [bacterium]|nr:transglycosylase domain-containing protein [candidate division CSSED10-310 bacterium]